MLYSMEEKVKKRYYKRRYLNRFDKSLADKIRWYRRNNNLTQEELSEKLGVHLNYISKVERYRSGVSLPMIYKLSRIFKIRIKDLFDF